jgi:hypothetical protein
MASLQRNVASQNLTFVMVSTTTGLGVAGLTISGFITKDNGAQAGTAGTFSDKTNGQYNYAPTQAETNAVDVGLLFAATGAIPVNMDFHTDNVDAQGLLKVDMEDVGGAALSTHAAGMVPADVRDIVGVAVSTTTAQLGVNVVQYNAQTAQTDANNLPKVDTEDWKGTAVAAPATAGIPDVNVKNINNIVGSGITAVNPNMGTTQPINFTGSAGSALVKSDMVDIAGAAVSTTVAQIGSNVINIAGQPAALDANNLLKIDVEDINGSATAGQALAQGTLSTCWGTAGAGGTTTTTVVSALHNPSSLTDTNQLIGRTIIFLGTTATGHVQGQASNITGSSTGATPTLTYTAMTAAPASGDVFVVL